MHKFIKIKGPEGARTGYFVPRLYQLASIRLGMKIFGFSYLKDRLAGWTYWWVDNEHDYERAIMILNRLKNSRIFDYKVWRER